MKEIANYAASKYQSVANYQEVAEGIYRCLDATADAHNEYVTSLSFVQEPELDEGADPSDISQYPLEDILDRFLVYISDFYEEVNAASEVRCQLEFAAPDLADVQGLRTIIGKHVYNQDDGELVDLMIEG